jgi:hypothetical protein
MTCYVWQGEGYRKYVAGYFIDRHYGPQDHKFVAPKSQAPVNAVPRARVLGPASPAPQLAKGAPE